MFPLGFPLPQKHTISRLLHCFIRCALLSTAVLFKWRHRFLNTFCSFRHKLYFVHLMLQGRLITSLKDRPFGRWIKTQFWARLYLSTNPRSSKPNTGNLIKIWVLRHLRNFLDCNRSLPMTWSWLIWQQFSTIKLTCHRGNCVQLSHLKRCPYILQLVFVKRAV